MIIKIVRCIVAALLLWLVWWAVGLLLAAVGAPAIIGTIILVLLIIGLVVFIAKEFGINV